jgi:hypothetical protein
MQSGGASPVGLSVGSPAPASEEEKQRAKREKLEAWKRAQAAKKAAQGVTDTKSLASPAVASPLKPSGKSPYKRSLLELYLSARSFASLSSSLVPAQ